MKTQSSVNNLEKESNANTAVEVPPVKLDPKLIEEVMSEYQEECAVIVHCSYTAQFTGGIRIWPSTVLIDQESGSRARLLHALDITMAPVWMRVSGGTTARFTLLFSALPKSCTYFTLFEDIPQPGGFEIRNIRRNKSDVYNVRISHYC